MNILDYSLDHDIGKNWNAVSQGWVIEFHDIDLSQQKLWLFFTTLWEKSQNPLRQIMGKLKYPTLEHQTSMYQ